MPTVARLEVSFPRLEVLSVKVLSASEYNLPAFLHLEPSSEGLNSI